MVKKKKKITKHIEKNWQSCFRSIFLEFNLCSVYSHFASFFFVLSLFGLLIFLFLFLLECLAVYTGVDRKEIANISHRMLQVNISLPNPIYGLPAKNVQSNWQDKSRFWLVNLTVAQVHFYLVKKFFFAYYLLKFAYTTFN